MQHDRQLTDASDAVLRVEDTPAEGHDRNDRHWCVRRTWKTGIAPLALVYLYQQVASDVRH